MLSINNIEVVYHDVILVLRGVSLGIEQAQVITLLGANGAGKTTTLKAISGLLKTEVGKVSHGDIKFDGKRIDRMGPEDIARMGIIQVLEGRRVLEQLSVEENLVVATYLLKDRSSGKQDLDRVYTYFPKLKTLRNQKSGYVSGGEQQMMLLGRALMAHPKLMLLDEPSLGLAPLLVQEIFKMIRQINEEEKTAMLLVEQNAIAALDIATYGYVMENGRVVLDGSASDLIENEDVKEFYLGFGALSQRKSYRDVKHYKRRKRWLG
ncbi:MAG: ABC transporter ATP-binding protein [Deltaproteobacteria bacterium]|nr:ABC transporter ATP-binding protein [Deltaproteobacteria bacterium]MBW2112028.1 ABC transporter ATP-binding protein [Deltaproteobacteria bacterium]MBW2353195.1 ABC transporter ATP-binding protein [Deltaproteobacteria bacterium]